MSMAGILKHYSKFLSTLQARNHEVNPEGQPSNVIQGVQKNLLESGEQYIVGSLFNFVFVRASDKTQNKCSKIVLFKSTIKLNNFSSDKKHNL